MKETLGDLWEYHDAGWWVGIPTNGHIRADGKATMGAGIAAQAAARYPELPRLLGAHLRALGNRLFTVEYLRIATIPTKHHWWDPADLDLIEQSALELRDWLDKHPDIRIAIPRLGCGCGRLEWKNVRPILSPILDDRVIVVNLSR
jgi:hypothetical protein